MAMLFNFLMSDSLTCPSRKAPKYGDHFNNWGFIQPPLDKTKRINKQWKIQYEVCIVYKKNQ
jgi:hypothetical protein